MRITTDRIDRRRVGKPARERGSALLIVMILLLLMTVVVLSNSLVLRHFKRELRLLEQQQKEKFQNGIPRPRPPGEPAPLLPLPPESPEKP